MNLENLSFGTMVAIIVAQVSVLTFALVTNQNPVEVANGFGIWGFGLAVLVSATPSFDRKYFQ